MCPALFPVFLWRNLKTSSSGMVRLLPQVCFRGRSVVLDSMIRATVLFPSLSFHKISRRGPQFLSKVRMTMENNEAFRISSSPITTTICPLFPCPAVYFDWLKCHPVWSINTLCIKANCIVVAVLTASHHQILIQELFYSRRKSTYSATTCNPGDVAPLHSCELYIRERYEN